MRVQVYPQLEVYPGSRSGGVDVKPIQTLNAGNVEPGSTDAAGLGG